jgi:hypothetical protein
MVAWCRAAGDPLFASVCGQELRFLDVKQGGDFLATPDEYTRRMSDFDLRVMIRTPQKKSMLDYLALARSPARGRPVR